MSTGSIHGIKNEEDENPEPTSSEKSEDVLQFLKKFYTFQAKLALASPVFTASSRKVGIDRWKIQSVNELFDVDEDHRLEFCTVIMEKMVINDSFHN